jgi:hypothetical protein
VSITIGFTAPVKDRSEVGPHELLPTFGFSPTPSALKRSAHFSVVALAFSVVIGLPFYAAEKPEKSPAGDDRSRNIAFPPHKNKAGRPNRSPRSVL